MVREGDIFITRNLKEEDNTSPGYWNHCAIYIGNKLILEAQEDPGKIISTPYDVFYNTYPKIMVYRHPKESVGLIASNHAKQLIGTEYWGMASIFRWLRKPSRGENCVSLVRRSYAQALGYDPKWKIPDHVTQDNQLNLVFKKDHEDFT